MSKLVDRPRQTYKDASAILQSFFDRYEIARRQQKEGMEVTVSIEELYADKKLLQKRFASVLYEIGTICDAIEDMR